LHLLTLIPAERRSGRIRNHGAYNFILLRYDYEVPLSTRLGNRSALDWVLDQYQVSTDKRSGIVSDPNRPEDEEYVVRLVGRVITVSCGTSLVR
jgi:hypothetical protein